MDDLISRQAAIDEANAWLLDCLKVNKQDRSCGLIRRLEDLPSVQPKRGLWIDDGSELGCQCSQCGKTLDEYINCGTEYMTLTEIPKFCPNCGAKMEVTE